MHRAHLVKPGTSADRMYELSVSSTSTFMRDLQSLKCWRRPPLSGSVIKGYRGVGLRFNLGFEEARGEEWSQTCRAYL